ncbi:SPASM domain-containing protein [bacterium]|nr:SPASM domain-containing protein [bacterium]
MAHGEPLFSAVEIEINHYCNRRCSYCPNSVAKRKNTGEMNPELFLKLLKELQDLGFAGRISYNFYNEPLLHSNFRWIVSQTRTHLPKSFIEVYTNGTELTHGIYTDLISAGVSHFVVTRHENEKNYVFEETFLRLSAEEKERVTYQGHTVLHLTNRGGLLKNIGTGGLPLTPCFIPEFIVTVTVNGNVLPCFEDFNETLVMGNLQEKRLLEIWNQDNYIGFRKNLRRGLRHQYSPCKNCNRTEVLPPETRLA